MQTVLITGGHKGLAFEAVRRIAATQRYDLILTRKNMRELEMAARQIREEFGVKILALHLDVSSLSSVRDACDEARRIIADSQVAPLGVLMCNAGAQFLGDIQYSADIHTEELWICYAISACFARS